MLITHGKCFPYKMFLDVLNLIKHSYAFKAHYGKRYLMNISYRKTLSKHIIFERINVTGYNISFASDNYYPSTSTIVVGVYRSARRNQPK